MKGIKMDNLTKLRYWTFKILPLVYDDSLSYYEVLAKVTNKVNELVDSNNTMPQAITDEITKQLDESYATNINNKINDAVNTVTENANNQIDKLASAVNTVTENANNQIDKLANEVYAKLISAIATDEGTNTFTKDTKSGGELLFLNGTLYKVTAVMPAGTNYIIGTNIAPVNISEELKTIKETYISTNNEHWNDRSDNNYTSGTYLFWKDILYVTTKDIKVNDILCSDGNNQNIKQITLSYEITNLNARVNENDSDIEKLQTEQTHQASRISNIISQSGNDNTEIVDGRLEAQVLGNSTYPSIGDAIRAQITKLYNLSLSSQTNTFIHDNSIIKDWNDVPANSFYTINVSGNYTQPENSPYSGLGAGIMITFANSTNVMVQVCLYNDDIYYRRYINAWRDWTNIKNTWLGKTISTNGITNFIYDNSVIKDWNDVPVNSFYTIFQSSGSQILPDHTPDFTIPPIYGTVITYSNTPSVKFQEIITQYNHYIRSAINNVWTEWASISGWNVITPNDSAKSFKWKITAGSRVYIEAGDYDLYKLGFTNNGINFVHSTEIVCDNGAHIYANLSEKNTNYSCINVGTKKITLLINGGTWEITNGRYVIHDEAGGTHGGNHTYKNMHMINNDAPSDTWAATWCIGGGATDGETVTIENCVFDCKAENSVSYHTDFNENQSKETLINVVGNYFKNGGIVFKLTGTPTAGFNIVYNNNLNPHGIKIPDSLTNIIKWNNTINAEN